MRKKTSIYWWIVWAVMVFAGFEIFWFASNHRTYITPEEVYIKRIGVVPGSFIEYHWEKTGQEEVRGYSGPFGHYLSVSADKDGVYHVYRDGALYQGRGSGVVDYTSPYGLEKENVSSEIYGSAFKEAEGFLEKTRKRFSGFLPHK